MTQLVTVICPDEFNWLLTSHKHTHTQCRSDETNRIGRYAATFRIQMNFYTQCGKWDLVQLTGLCSCCFACFLNCSCLDVFHTLYYICYALRHFRRAILKLNVLCVCSSRHLLLIPKTLPPVTYLLTYLLTPWCKILFENLSLSLWKISCFLYKTRRFITAFRKARHCTLSWASRIQFAPSIPISLRSTLMLSFHLRLDLSSGLLRSGLPTKTL